MFFKTFLSFELLLKIKWGLELKHEKLVFDLFFTKSTLKFMKYVLNLQKVFYFKEKKIL